MVLGTVAVGTGGTATFTTSFAAAGGHLITATYNGNSIFVASAQALTEQVNAPTTPRPTTTLLSASANPAEVGQAVTFTATVRDPSGTGTPTGTRLVLRGHQAGGAGDARCQRPGEVHPRLLAHGPVHHPGGLQRRRQLQRQLPVLTEQVNTMIRGG